MKKYIIVLSVIFAQSLFAQVSIGKTNVDGNGILDFYAGTDNVKGIVLPRTTNAQATESGTLVFDATSKKVQYFNKDTNTWEDLTEAGIYTELLSSSSTEISDGVIIGSETSTAKGALVLEATDKALILPKIENPHLTVNQPEAGMICYDTASDSVAIFNGEKWYYWK